MKEPSLDFVNTFDCDDGMKKYFIISFFIFSPTLLLAAMLPKSVMSCQVITTLDQGLSDVTNVDLFPTSDPNTFKGTGGDFVIESWTAADYTTVTLRDTVDLLKAKNARPLFSVQGKSNAVKEFIGGTLFLDMKSITMNCRTK